MVLIILLAIIAGVITFIADRKYAYAGIFGWIRTIVYTIAVTYSVGSLAYIMSLII